MTNITEHVAGARWHLAGSTDTVVVFVHGLMSTSRTCWSHKNGTYWPQLVAQDPQFEAASVYLADYYSDIDSGQYDIAQCAREVWDQLQSDRENGRVPIDYSRIVFVAHSLGGVVVRRLLEENSQRFSLKQVGLVLIASPTGGSLYAKRFGALSKLYGHDAALALKPDSQLLRDIDHRFRGLLNERRIDLIGAEACEHHGPRLWKYFPYRLSPIVSVESSSKYFGAPKIIHGTDHSSIVKPDRAEHPIHQFLRNFYGVHWARNQRGRSVSTGNANSGPTGALFSVYSAAARPYCVTRDVDTGFSTSIGLKSVWVHGQSGVGKTTLVKRYLDLRELNPLQISLGHMRDFTEASLTREITETINSKRNSNLLGSYADLVRFLASEFGSERIILFLDEVPVEMMSTEEQRMFLISVSALMDSVQKQGGANLHIVVCSIGKPHLELAGQKCQEQIELLQASQWTERELGELVNIIKSALSVAEVGRLDDSDLINVAGGSPRVIKEYYRRRLIVGPDRESEQNSLNIVLNTLGLT